MKKNKEKPQFEDDGRVVAPMNVDGMPWYDGRSVPSHTEGTEAGGTDFRSMSKEEKREYRKDTRKIIFGIMRYLVPIVLLFVVVFLVAILIMRAVWH